MALPASFTFEIENDQYLKWTLVDGETAVPITNATVTATLYTGRDPVDPITTPGTAVTGFNNLSLTHQGSGVYRGQIPHAFVPSVATGGYILVVIATQPGGSQGKWEIPSVVAVRKV
jgi:hypothetical protein